MKIALVSPLPPANDGLAAYSAGIWRAYEGAGHEVAAITTGPATGPPGGPPMLGHVTLNPLKMWRLCCAVRTWRPALVHVQHTVATYGPSLLALWLVVLSARSCGSRILVTHHEVTRDIGRLGTIGRIYYRLTASLTHRLHVHTRAAAALFEDLGVDDSRILISPHPVFDLPPAAVTPGELRAAHDLERKIVVLQFGFVHVDKGLSEAVKAWGVLMRRRPDLRATARLVIAGAVRMRPVGFGRFELADHEYLRAVAAQVAEGDLSDCVCFTGHVPDEHVSAWFSLADLVLLPYTNTEQSGVANVAIAAGAPVLSTRNAGLDELFDELPRLHDLAPEPFSRSVESAIDNLPELRSQAAAAYDGLRLRGSPGRLIESALDQTEVHGGH